MISLHTRVLIIFVMQLFLYLPDTYTFFDTWSAYKSYEAGDTEQAQEKFATVIINNPQEWRALYNLGTIALNEQLYDDAVCHFEKTVAINPDHAQARERLEIARKLRDEQKEQERQQQKDKEQKDKEEQDKENKENQQNSDQKQEKQEQQKQKEQKNNQAQQQEQQKQQKSDAQKDSKLQEEQANKTAQERKQEAVEKEKQAQDKKSAEQHARKKYSEQTEAVFAQLDKLDQQMQKQMMQANIRQADSRKHLGQNYDEKNW